MVPCLGDSGVSLLAKPQKGVGERSRTRLPEAPRSLFLQDPRPQEEEVTFGRVPQQPPPRAAGRTGTVR